MANGLEIVGEEGRHLGRRLQIELVRVEPHPPGRVEIAARADAQQHVVRVVLLPADVVQVVGDDEIEPDFGGEAEQLGVQGPLVGQAVVLQLEEEAIFAEDLAVHAGGLARQVPVVDFERLGHLAAETGREADQALRVLGEVFVVDAGPVVVAVEMRVGDQAAEVLVALPVLGQQDQVEGLAVGLALFVAHAPPGHVSLDPDDRLDAPRGRGLDERDGPVEGAVVGDGHGVEAERGALIGKLGDAPESVQQAELGVKVQVDEVIRRDGHGSKSSRQHGLAAKALRPIRVALVSRCASG